MDVKIKRFDRDLSLPKYQTNGSVAVDLYAREKIVVEPNKIALIPANIALKVPDGYVFLVSLRSSVPKKKGLCMPHGVGVIDQDYCGELDEVKIQVMNVTENNVEILRGERIAQGMFLKVGKVEWEEVLNMNEPDRGGFGSTGEEI